MPACVGPLRRIRLPSNCATAADLTWRDAASFEIEGRGWAKTAGAYDRLPDSARSKVSKTAWDLSKETSGVCVRFVTDAAAVSVRWSVTSESLAMPRMAATGVSGVDLYTRSNDGSLAVRRQWAASQARWQYRQFEFRGGGRAGGECLLYLPVYNGTKSLEIGVPPGASLRMPEPRPEALRKPIVVYGTSIVQRGCATRPGDGLDGHPGPDARPARDQPGVLVRGHDGAPRRGRFSLRSTRRRL